MRAIRVTLVGVILGVSSWTVNAQASSAPVASATLDSSGAIRISYSDGTDIAAPKIKGQVGFGHPFVARDQRTVGWLAMFPNCCTSYPTPLSLVVYRDGKILASISPGRSIFHWIFLSGGNRVALCTDALHGDSYPNYELHEAKSGRLIASWDPGEAREQPKWVGLLRSDNTNDLYP